MGEFELRRVGFQWMGPIERHGRPDQVRVSLGHEGLKYQRVVAVVDEQGLLTVDVTDAVGSRKPMRVVEPDR